jgi:hypothetical protein
MLIISHRVNSISELINTPLDFGVEVDVRSWEDQIILNHEPFEKGELFKKWLKNFNHPLIILNVKNEGIETRAIKELQEANSNINYFLLDQSFPMLVRTIKSNLHTTAMRISDLEGLQHFENIKPKWVWLDSHSGDWDYLFDSVEVIAKSGTKICIASPELHGRNPEVEINQIKGIFKSKSLDIDAVCTKIPNKWKNTLS